MSAKIAAVKKNSIAEELGIKPGDKLLSVDGQILKDYIEYQFYNASDTLELEIGKKNGETEIFEIEKDFEEDLGLIFEDLIFDKIKHCSNRCIFCFVDQQPKGLRDTLYIKDDDYRLSYLNGTYITLTNLTKSDKDRIAREHLGPLFVSVHTTNPKLRVQMLNNKNAGKILEELEFLEKNEIPFNAQIVLCPGYNDREELIHTLNDLDKFKNLVSVAIVPVGITKYRTTTLKEADKECAKETIKITNEFIKRTKRTNVCCSDEFFLKAEMEVPFKEYYGDFAQLSDGVGALRLLLDDFDNRIKKLPEKLEEKKELIFATSGSVYKTFCEFSARLNKTKNLTTKVVEIRNDFWGEGVSIAGLITSVDLICALKEYKNRSIVIPSVMLQKNTNRFLDGKTLKEVEKELDCRFCVIKDIYSTKEIFKEITKRAE